MELARIGVESDPVPSDVIIILLVSDLFCIPLRHAVETEVSDSIYVAW
jgi:hypothetical protein